MIVEEKEKPVISPENETYKIIIMPFTKSDAMAIRNYLTAFCKNKTVEIQAI